MENDLKELKSVLRSLVVSSPTEVDLRTLLRDYRNMMGETIPLAKFGYRDGLSFIKEQCSDCFVIQDSGCNPVLMLIVPDAVKHIDKFVQKQKSTPTARFKSKRKSVPESAFKNNDLIVRTFKAKAASNKSKTDYTAVKENKELFHNSSHSYKHTTTENDNKEISKGVSSSEESIEVTNSMCSKNALQNFMKKRIPDFNSSQCLDSEICLEKDSSRGDTDSGRQTASSNSSNKKAQLEELKTEVREVVAEVPEGVWCTELMRLYREKYGRELNFSRFGFTSVLSLAYAVDELQYCVAEHTGELLLRAGAAPAAGGVRARPAAPATPPLRRVHATGDPEDALPGIDFDEDVFPRDCMHIMQSIPTQSLDELAPGAMLEVVLGEVYSPTHFWLLRLGPAHYSAMEVLMDDMNTYYRGEGRERALAGGALRVGHYCACCYLGDWHRAVIVKILDSDTVKVRHIDYATVESVEARSLKPLLRRWAVLPAQALRARLAGARPPAAGRRWPWAAAAHFLALVKERRLVANVVAKDAQEGILEVLLIDTSTEEDVCISTEMCRSGHADPRPDSALGTSECYLFPRFHALETGDTPNYAEIYCYLRDGISLEFVEDYRRHVPPCLPPLAPLASVARRLSPTPESCDSYSSPPPSDPSPSLRDPSPPPREPSPPLSKPASMSGKLTSALPLAIGTRSLNQLAANAGPREPCTTRATFNPPADTDSWLKSIAVVNRIPCPCPEPSASPRPAQPPPQPARQPQNSRSHPAGGFPAPVYPMSPPSLHLSPFAPPFYPQSFAPPLPTPHNYLATYPVLFSEHAQFCPGPALVPPTPPLELSVPVSECEIFTLLSRVDPVAAQRYMVDALSRAVANACVTRGPPAGAHAGRPPPGFERARSQPPSGP